MPGPDDVPIGLSALAEFAGAEWSAAWTLFPNRQRVLLVPATLGCRGAWRC